MGNYDFIDFNSIKDMVLIMKKILTYSVAAVVSVFIMTPPWNINVTCQVNNLLWLWSVALAGLLCFFYVHTSAPMPIKLLVVYAFVGSFFSVAPYWSFMMTIPTVVSAYFYLACRQIEDFSAIQKAVQSAFFLICAFLVVQLFGYDTLYNFNRPEPMVIGVVGNKMISATLIACLSPFLLSYKKLNIIPLCLIALMTQSVGMIFALALGIAFYSFLKANNLKRKLSVVIITLTALLFIIIFQFQHIKGEWTAGRGPIWKKTIELANQRPIKGRGISSYQLVFPALSHDLITPLGRTDEWEIENIRGRQVPALQTHNDYLQIYFEMGLIGVALFGAFIFYLMRLFKVCSDKAITATTGLVILGALMFTHFPLRLFHVIPVILCFLAFYENTMRKENGGLICPAHPRFR